jgi:hypothetical protein
MKITRLFTGADKQSYFEEIEANLIDADYGKITNPIAVNSIVFGENRRY